MNSRPRINHEIDYKIHGEELQFVEIELDPNETAIAESGAMLMMDEGYRCKPSLVMDQRSNPPVSLGS
jgi:uncharacterized protein (AIM24 family)